MERCYYCYLFSFFNCVLRCHYLHLKIQLLLLSRCELGLVFANVKLKNQSLVTYQYSLQATVPDWKYHLVLQLKLCYHLPYLSCLNRSHRIDLLVFLWLLGLLQGFCAPRWLLEGRHYPRHLNCCLPVAPAFLTVIRLFLLPLMFSEFEKCLELVEFQQLVDW